MTVTKTIAVFLVSTVLLANNACHTPRAATTAGKEIRFKKTTLDSVFVAEGVAVADVNKDGKMDILSGAFWYEAPGWARHELQPGKTYDKRGYSNSFLDFSLDVNGDGWMDLINIPTPGAAATWYENPKNKPGFWVEHALYPSVGNESPALHDLNGDGVMDLVCNNSKTKKMVWVSAPRKGDTAWTEHIISNDSLRGTHMYTHGLGFGDMNGDGREDVLMREGWWEAPADRTQQDWTFHPGAISDECAQMYVMDLDGDGDRDVISSSAHNYGLWWHEQVKSGDAVTWVHHEIFKGVSQTHGLALVDMNGDGHPDLVTGKRYYAHSAGDPGIDDPAMLYWFEYKPGKTPTWTPHAIDNASGVGLHLVTADMNSDGRVDVVIGNKKGVFYFEQMK